ncbi:MAG: DUF1501 domain-containing protein [Planctomycetota bacterium]|nr:DUF1501 domain-containing protein [Planctomycetota bacterium]
MNPIETHPPIAANRPDRRAFLLGGAAAATALTLPRVTFAAATSSAVDSLVLVFLRGGMDALSFCSPYADPNLQSARPGIAMPGPGLPNGVLYLDSFFGLHPQAAPLMAAYQSGQLLIVHASGSPASSRSHFEAQNRMESGASSQPGLGLSTGWVARHLAVQSGAGVLRGMGTSDTLTRALTGSTGVLPIRQPGQFRMPGATGTAYARRVALDGMYQQASAELASAGRDTFATIDLLGSIDFQNYAPSGGASYPATPFGAQFQDTAALLKANVGVRCVEIDLHGWDHHTNLGAIGGSFAALTSELAQTLAAFRTDMGGAFGGVDVVVMTEFGRRVAPNGNLGLDHGRGGCMILMGGGVAGGRVLTQWPGLAPSQLHDGDLAITIDYRDVLGEMLVRRFGCTNLPDVFPGYTPQFRGVAL